MREDTDDYLKKKDSLSCQIKDIKKTAETVLELWYCFKPHRDCSEYKCKKNECLKKIALRDLLAVIQHANKLSSAIKVWQ